MIFLAAEQFLGWAPVVRQPVWKVGLSDSKENHMTAIREYLLSGRTLDELAARYAVRAIRHGVYPNLVRLNYSQIASPFAEPLVRECRGIVLDESNDWAPVARGFDKFFNFGEPLAPVIDWTTARVQEKIDGTFCMAYFYDGDWHVATTGLPDASGPVGSAKMTFAELFWRTFDRNLLGDGLREFTILFELTTPLNTVVVEQKEARVTLLGMRHTASGRELTASEAGARLDGVPLAREFAFGGVADVLASFDAIDPRVQEGYVVVDSAFRRVKVKHPGYVRLHHLKYSLTTKRLVDAVRIGEGGEIAATLPELADRVRDVETRLARLCSEIDGDYERLRDVEDPRAFALAARATRFPAALFNLRKGVIESPRTFFARMRLETLMELLEYRGESILDME